MMGIFSSLFHSRDKPTNSTAGSAYTFFLGSTTSGKAVTERSAMQMTAVYSCVRILAEAVAGLPLHLYRYKADGGKEKALVHPLYHLLHDEPNPEMANNSDGRYSEFTTRIRCEHCGSTFRRNTQPSKSASGGKMHYWRCPTSGNCVTTGIREDRLKDITASVMGLAKHDAESFKEQVEYISVSGDMKLTFHFFDGADQVIQYNTKRQGTPWTEERHKKFSESMRGKYTEERREAMSQRMKQIRSEKHWSSKRK